MNRPLDTVLHPISTEVQKVVEEEKSAADEAIKQKEDKKEPIKPVEEKRDTQAELEALKSQALRLELKGDFWEALQLYYKIKKLDSTFPRVDIKIEQLERELRKSSLSRKVTEAVYSDESEAEEHVSQKVIPRRLIAGITGVIALIVLFIWGGVNLWNNNSFSERDSTNTPVFTKTSTSQPIKTNTPAPTKTETSIPPTPMSTSEFGIGSTMTGKDGMTLLYVPAGEFTMGSEDGDDSEKHVHIVFLDAFWIDQTEVTNAMYAKCVTDGQCAPPSSVNSNTHTSYYGNSEFDNYPVIYVSWDDANKYCSWADRRLPTEAEWEKAARGTDERVHPWGDDAPNNDLLNYNSAVKDTTEVGSYPLGTSPYGALDMAGNILEWVADRYDFSYYSNSPSSNPQGPVSGQSRVLRGGSWFNNDLRVGSADRGWNYPSSSSARFGFRCSRSP